MPFIFTWATKRFGRSMKIPSAISLYFKCLTPFLIEKMPLPIRRGILKKRSWHCVAPAGLSIALRPFCCFPARKAPLHSSQAVFRWLMQYTGAAEDQIFLCCAPEAAASMVWIEQIMLSTKAGARLRETETERKQDGNKKGADDAVEH